MRCWGSQVLAAVAIVALHVGCSEIPSQSGSKVVCASGYWPWQTFKTSEITPPSFQITGEGSGSTLDPDNLFITPDNTGTKGGNGSYPMIFDNDGELIFAIRKGGTTDLRSQIFNGTRHLTYWSGFNTRHAKGGHGYGHVCFYDEHYTNFTFSPDIEINALSFQPWLGKNGLVDLHEHQMVEPGTTMLMTVYNNTPADLGEFGIENGWVANPLVAEVDIASGDILFLWNPADHGISYRSSNEPIGVKYGGNGTEFSPWDWCHINSAEKVGDNFLINSRQLWTTWFVDGHTGSIIWSLNGENGGDFGALPNGSTFSWQHHARAHNMSDQDITISIFNNHNTLGVAEERLATSGLLLKLSLPPNKDTPPVVLRNVSVPSDPLYTTSQGAYTTELSNGNAFLGYGDLAIAREFGEVVGNQNQKLLREWKWGNRTEVQSYRAFKTPWHATPAGWDPVLVVEQSASGEPRAYVSWNGATDVTEWHVSAGLNASDLKFIGIAKKRGFETTFAVASNSTSKYQCVSVVAGIGGKSVRKSNIACV